MQAEIEPIMKRYRLPVMVAILIPDIEKASRSSFGLRGDTSNLALMFGATSSYLIEQLEAAGKEDQN